MRGRVVASFGLVRNRRGLVARGALAAAVAGLLLLSGSAIATATGSATKLVFTISPSSATGDTAFTTQPKVAVEDTDGNIVTGDSSTVSLQVNAPSSGGPGSLSGCSQTETNGVISFSGCKVDKVGSGYMLTATDGSLTAAVSGAFNITPGPAAQVIFTQQPTDIQAGADFSPDVALRVADAGGNTVTAGSYTLGLGVATGPGSLTCTGGETAAPANATPGYKLAAVSGAATFTDCTIKKASSASAYQLVGVASDGTADGTFTTGSSNFTVSSGDASQLVFTTNPTGAQAAQSFGTQPVVAVEDAAGNLVPAASGTVSLAIKSGTGTAGATLTCPSAATSGGIATFSGCGLDRVGSNYVLTATITGNAYTGSSAPFLVSGSGPASVGFTIQPVGGTGGAPMTQPVVAVTDGGGNPVSASVSLALQGGPAGAKLTCSANPQPAGTGTATFAGCSVDLAGTYRLVATVPASRASRRP